MERSTVSIVRGDVTGTQTSYTDKDVQIVRDMLMQTFENLGGLKKVLGDSKKVLIKPNLVEVPYPKTAGSVLTDPRLLEALCLILKEYGIPEVLVGEGRSVNLKHLNAGATMAFENTGLGEAAKRGGAEVIAWDEHPFVPVKHPKLTLWDVVMVPKSIVDCDFFINLPKLKTHGQSEITCAIKSLQGVYSTEDKIKFHTESFPWKMLDMLRVADFDLNIVDGIICGEGFGPIYTTPVPVGVIVGSTDTVATDSVISEIMGIEGWEVPITRLAATEGIGNMDLDKIDIVGTPLDEVRGRFKRPALWNPIGYHKRLQVYAGGASRFELAQIAASVQRLEWDGVLERLEEDICLICGDFPPVPKREFKHVIIVGDAAIRDCTLDGVEIPGNPPLPSVQIVETIKEMMGEDK